MEKIMKCEQVTEQFLDLLLGNLDKTVEAQIQEHLALCASCRAETENLQAIWTNLESLPEEQPSEALRTRFYAMLEAYEQGRRQAQSARRWREVVNDWLAGWWPKQPAFQFTVAVMLLIVGLFAGHRLNTPKTGSQEIAQLRTEVHTMRQLVTLSLLQQQSPSERLRGVSWSYQMEQPDAEVLSALLHTLDYDPNVNVRLAAVDALYLFRDHSLVRQGLVQSIPRQSSPLVQVALINLIVEMRETRAIEALRQLIQDDKLNQLVRERAEWGIKQLS
jgi:hypothetical protein